MAYWKKEIILGGDGFIGSYLAKKLADLGRKVEIYDIQSGFDLRDQIPLDVDSNTYVWFLAWDLGNAEYLLSDKNQDHMLKHNLSLCMNVFPWLIEKDLPFTFTSTQMTSGKNAYGLTKLIGEYWASLSKKALVAKFWNVYGVETKSSNTRVVSDMIAAAKTGEIVCKTNGRERRQFVYVKDAVDALIFQRECGQKKADITSNEWVSIIELADAISRKTNASVMFSKADGYEHIVEPENLLKGWEMAHTIDTGLDDILLDMGNY